jgi:hypothetical protein
LRHGSPNLIKELAGIPFPLEKGEEIFVSPLCLSEGVSLKDGCF